MSMTIGASSLYPYALDTGKKTDSLEKSLKNLDKAEDKELMEVCKSFESYMLEQVFKKMDASIQRNEEEGEYVSYFKDMMFQEYAKDAIGSQDLGIARMLYESMSQNLNKTVK